MLLHYKRIRTEGKLLAGAAQIPSGLETNEKILHVPLAGQGPEQNCLQST